MSPLSIFIIVGICLLTVSYAGPVLSLEEEELDGYISKNQIVILDVYSPECPHCKELAPEFLKAAKTAKKQNKPYHFVKINGNQNPGLGPKFKITGYPTIKLFVNGSPIDYDGNRTADAIMDFIDKKSSRPSTLLSTLSEIKDVISGTGLRGILGTKDKKSLDYYLELIRDEDDFKFYDTSMELIKEAFPEVTDDPTFILLKDFDELKVSFSRYGLPKRYFKEFLRYHEYQIVNPCNEKIFGNLKGENSARVLILLLHDDKDPSIDEMREEFRKVAEEKRSTEYAFIMSNISEGVCKNFAENNGIHQSDLPTIQLVHIKNWKSERFAHKGPFTKEAIDKFIKNWKDGNENQVYKSEQPPIENPGPVYKVVGATFDEMVIKPDQDVLVKFYAPWCGHCKNLAPIYEELAKKLSNDKHVKLVEIDSTQNEIPSVHIGSYPTLKLYTAADKDHPIPYEGERTTDAMETFLKEHSSFKNKEKPDL